MPRTPPVLPVPPRTHGAITRGLQDSFPLTSPRALTSCDALTIPVPVWAGRLHYMAEGRARSAT